MNLSFVSGPLDGLNFDCPLTPPICFFLPTDMPKVVSLYEFVSIGHNSLVYRFGGYSKMSEKQAKYFFNGGYENNDELTVSAG